VIQVARLIAATKEGNTRESRSKWSHRRVRRDRATQEEERESKSRRWRVVEEMMGSEAHTEVKEEREISTMAENEILIEIEERKIKVGKARETRGIDLGETETELTMIETAEERAIGIEKVIVTEIAIDSTIEREEERAIEVEAKTERVIEAETSMTEIRTEEEATSE
jgi:hypothetical protein